MILVKSTMHVSKTRDYICVSGRGRRASLGATECKADCCTGTDTVLILMSMFLLMVLEEVITFKWQKNKEIRKERERDVRSSSRL